MKNWTRVTRKNPCPICAKFDWCCIGEKGTCCMRIESKHPLNNGGWFHPFDTDQPRVERRYTPPPPPRPSINAAALIELFAETTTVQQIAFFAESIGVSEASIAVLGAAYTDVHRAWAFPMRDINCQVVGIRLRATDGKKWAVTGSRQGIFVPQMAAQPTLYICEGPTDTAAAISLGFFAVGRPSCNSGGPEIRALCKRMNVARAIVISDDDTPGLKGAEKIQNEIGIPSTIYVPPTKDIREFYRLGGTKQEIESSLRSKLWVNYEPIGI